MIHTQPKSSLEEWRELTPYKKQATPEESEKFDNMSIRQEVIALREIKRRIEAKAGKPVLVT
jgi:hypothetical protein